MNRKRLRTQSAHHREHKVPTRNSTERPINLMVENGLEQLNAAVTDSNQIVCWLVTQHLLNFTNLSRGARKRVNIFSSGQRVRIGSRFFNQTFMNIHHTSLFGLVLKIFSHAICGANKIVRCRFPGKVSSTAGEPLPGATLVLNDGQATVTDIHGHYRHKLCSKLIG